MATLEDLMQLERVDRDIFHGKPLPSKLPRTFGGQVAGQALRAAMSTVEPEFDVHSLHGYFLNPGRPTEPTVFLIDRIRDGRSFITRRVTGIQNGEAIFSMSASFALPSEGLEHADPMPDAPEPESVPDARDLLTGPTAELWKQEWEHWDVRIVPQDRTVAYATRAVHQQVWVRYRKPMSDNHIDHVTALAYMSDMTLINSARLPHPGVATQVASLDHAMWFLRRFRADDWLLYDQSSPFAGEGRALTGGRIFTREGRIVAMVMQEGLQRIKKR